MALARFNVRAAGLNGGLSVNESTPLSLSGVEWLGWSGAGPPGDWLTLVSCVTGGGLVRPSPWENNLKDKVTKILRTSTFIRNDKHRI